MRCVWARRDEVVMQALGREFWLGLEVESHMLKLLAHIYLELEPELVQAALQRLALLKGACFSGLCTGASAHQRSIYTAVAAWLRGASRHHLGT